MTAHSGKLEPGADAARGEVAMMVMAFAEKYLSICRTPGRFLNRMS